MKRLLPVLLLLLSSAVMAESGAYLVEAIIFRNLEVTAEAEAADELRSFSHLPQLDEVPASLDSAEEILPEPAAIPRSDLPDDLRVVTQKSLGMDDAWRRLRSSAEYRPLIYAAWQQNRTDYYPPMRIHDQQIIAKQLRPPTPIMVADLTADDPLAAYRSTFYQIDGSLQLRRSRFLHLYLDLEFRESALEPASDSGAMGNNAVLPGPASEPLQTGNYRVYSLKQNRQVRTGRMQYFDSPHFGVLVLVSPIAPE
jgi:hypothetical protein